eukprot:452757-Hanusia_phi.AAC.1
MSACWTSSRSWKTAKSARQGRWRREQLGVHSDCGTSLQQARRLSKSDRMRSAVARVYHVYKQSHDLHEAIESGDDDRR